MKVLFSAGIDDYTGANRMTRTYMQRIVSSGDQVMLLHSQAAPVAVGQIQEPRLSALTRADGITTLEIPDFPFKITPGSILRIIVILAETRPDIVVATFQSDAKIMGPLCAMKRIPFVYWAQNIGEFSGSRVFQFLKKKLWSFLLRESVTVIVAAGREVSDDLVRNHGVVPSALRIITNAVELPPVQERVRTQAILREMDADESTFVILNVGRLDEQKDQLTLIEAARTLVECGVDFRLLLAGGVSPTGVEKSMAYRAQLAARIEELGLEGKVILLGWRNDVGELLAQADVYAHSARWEGFPLAVLDAWAASLPVVVTDCFHIPGASARPGWGSVVPVGDAGGLAAGILKIQRSSADERYRMGVEARRFAEAHFDLGSRVREMRDCMTDLLEARGSGHVI